MPLLIVYAKHDNFVFVRLLLICALSLLSFQAFAEDLTTTDGKQYLNVKVVKVEDDAITVVYKEGGALIPMTKLPPALQKRFSYDPDKAKVAADARNKSDAENAKELQAEIELAQKMKNAKAISDSSSTNAAPKISAPH